MKPITDLWGQLVRRRLWPVALLLVAALAAVPMLLAKDPEPAPPAPAPGGGVQTANASLASEPIVAPGEAVAPGTDRQPLGERHDIFKPTKKAPKVKAAKDEPKPEAESEESKPAGGDSGSKEPKGSEGGGTSTPATPAEPAPAPKTYPLYSLKIRFSQSEDGGEKRHLPRLSPLPSREEPLIVYLGLLEDRKTAVFLLDATLRAIGDGECRPTPDTCETVRMQIGDTMFFDVVDEKGEPSGSQYQLDLLGIVKKDTTDAAKAAKSAKLAKVASASQLQGGALGGETLRRLGVVGRTG